MNNMWSTYVQGVRTLYESRRLRFHDLFREQYLPLFGLDAEKPLCILEIGCGPGALAGALHRWYPHAAVTALDRDSSFIRFAKEHVPGVSFTEGDATALPFPDRTFDVTISNTVAEHIAPDAFYGEQRRVLKEGGVCLVISTRKSFRTDAPDRPADACERAFWDKAKKAGDSLEPYEVCRYPMNEAELPTAMQKYGFSDIRTGYAVIDLTPDHPKFSASLAHEIIHADRTAALERIDGVQHRLHGRFSDREAEEIRRLTNDRFDARLALYDRGVPLWDTSVSLLMILRGIRAPG